MELRSSWLAGKTALATGAAKRVGRATALALAAQGVHVVIHYRASRDEAESTASEARDMGAKAWTIQAALRKPTEVERILPHAVEAAGPIQMLINNASIFTESRITDFTVEDLADNVQVNAVAPLLIARAFAAQGCEGAIVTFLDTRLTEYDREHAASHLSKRMLFTLTRIMALEFAPDIRVNAIAPGLILPPPGKDRSSLESLASTNPLHRIGTPRDITDAVLFLLQSDFITGQVIFVDGGYHYERVRVWSRPLDRIHIRDVLLRCVIGVNDWEREIKQDVLINITLHADLKTACQTGRLEDTVDYKAIRKNVAATVESSSYMRAPGRAGGEYLFGASAVVTMFML